MEKFCLRTTPYWKRAFFGLVAATILIALPLQAWGASIAVSVDTTLNTDSTADDYNIDTDNVTLTNNANLSLGANDTVDVVPASTGVHHHQ